MVRKSIEDQLSQLEVRRRELKARLTTQERAKNTRRKVLIGELILKHLESAQTGTKNADAERLLSWVQHELPSLLTREADQALFADILTAKSPPKMSDAKTETGIQN